MSFVPLVRLWLWISAFATLAGWTLSLFGQLNRTGYGIAFAVFAIFILAARRRLQLLPGSQHICRQKFLRRFRRPLPLGFGALAFLIFLGGALYPPTHFNAMTYHIPRVLHWLTEGHWHWIHSPVVRMDFSGCDFEWLFAPLLLFTKSDRGLFLLNWVAFLLLPGLLFSVFTRLGVRARVAWPWMWLFPTGYIFLLQAGSAGNDAFAAVYALAMIDFGCRAWESRRAQDFWCSLLAAGLLVGTKPISLPLLLPWMILILPLLPILRRRVLGTSVVVTVAMAVSFLPLAILNKHYCGDWLGASIEPSHVKIHEPLTGIFGNGFKLLMDNFVPPLFPQANWWNQHAAQLLPHSWFAEFESAYFQVWELPTEDWAGIGFGLSVLLVVSMVAAFFTGRRSESPVNKTSAVPDRLRGLVLIAPWISLLAFGVTSAMSTPARLIAPYYPLLLPSLLVGVGLSRIVRRRWWRVLAGGVLILAFVVLALSPDRPLWPAKTVLSKAHAQHPDQHIIARALTVYTVYSQRSDSLAGIRALLPREIKTIGFIGTEDDSDLSLWRPFGERQVKHFFLADPPEQVRQQVQYVVVGGFNLKNHQTTLDAWLQQSGATLVASTNATMKITEGPQPWYLVRFKP